MRDFGPEANIRGIFWQHCLESGDMGILMEKDRNRLDWYESYYVGEGIRNPEKIVEKLNDGKLVTGIYLVTLSENPGNILEMFSASLLKQEIFRELCPTIIGIAKGKDGAIQMAQQLVEESLKATGSCRITEYLKNR